MKTALTAFLLLALSACTSNPNHRIDTSLDDVRVEITTPPSPAGVYESTALSTGPVAADIQKTLHEMNDTLENCIGPAFGLDFKRGVCEAPRRVCQ